MEVSPKYLMKLIDEIEKTLWSLFTESKYKNVKYYIKKWHQCNDNYNFNDYWENFKIYEDNGNIDLRETLHNIDSETIIKIAIDLGIETPDFIPAIPVIKNVLKNNYLTSYNTFEKALKQIEENPDLAIGTANSALESIIKHILEDDKISISYNKKDTLYDLTQAVLKEFALFPNQEMPNEIKEIGSKLLNLSQNIEKLRSEKTTFHGKIQEEYVIEDPLYAYFIVNAISTIGLFLMSFYSKKYSVNILEDKKEENESPVNYESEVKPEDLPF